MSRFFVWAALVGLAAAAYPHAQASQSGTPLEFDVASIKRNTSPLGAGGAMRTLPDGTFMMSNQPIMTIIGSASPVEGILLRNMVGLPDWARTDNYDITVRPPAGSTVEQRREMWQTLFTKRMHLVAHVEQREASTYALVVARSDGRLGPALKKSTLDCTPGASPQPPQSPTGNGPPDFSTRCGMMTSGTSIVSGGMTMDMLARNLQGRAGGPVTNQTGLDGFYAFTLKFAPPRGASVDVAPDDQPEFFTALQEQLGLKLQSTKGTVPYLIIDHIDRPTDN